MSDRFSFTPVCVGGVCCFVFLLFVVVIVSYVVQTGTGLTVCLGSLLTADPPVLG